MSSSTLLNPLASINEELADRLEHDELFRRDYIRLWAQSEVAEEIRKLRKRRNKRQAELAALIGTGQSAISRIEKADYDGWSYKTLLAVAERLKARLRITFEPIEDVARAYRSSDTTGTDEIIVLNGGDTADDQEFQPSSNSAEMDPALLEKLAETPKPTQMRM